MTTELAARARDLTLALVRRPSVTGTPDETSFGPWLHDQLAAWPYFAAHPQDLHCQQTDNDPHERSIVAALVRGSGRATVVLTGHYDTVSLADYGALAPLACEPLALLPALIAALDASTTPADARAAADLRSGDWLPGRAILDMKSGLGAALAVLEAFAANHDRTGNLLFLAVPDEEQLSHGMRSAAQHLPALAAAWGLNLVAAINTDATVDTGNGSAGRAIFLGSVGKLLPTALILGCQTHVGAPFDGVSATLLAAEIARTIEGNPACGDPQPTDGALPPAPVVLQLRDQKPGYDVTTPAAVFLACNLLTHCLTPDAALTRFGTVVQAALDTGMATHRARAAQAGAAAAFPPAMVLTYAELVARAAGRVDTAELDQIAANPAYDQLDVARLTTLALLRAAAISGPLAVIGFAPIYYPAARLTDAPAHARLRAIVARVAATPGTDDQPLVVRPFFPGISDVSFLCGQDTAATLAAARAQTPGWDARWPIDTIARNLPTINIGPWGRDYHQRSERLYTPYAFGQLPRLLQRICTQLVQKD